MDPLTHACLGAAAAISASPREDVRAAGAVGGAAALAPDLDVLVRSTADPLLVLEVHRQFTHSLLVAPALAGAAALLLLPLTRGRLPGVWVWLYAFLGVVSACLLDACTSYGTALAWPLSDARFAASIVAVVDPAITVPLAILTGFCVVRRNPGPAVWGIALVVAYLGFGWVQSERAAYASRTIAGDRGHSAERFEVKPTLGNLVLWRSIYRAEGHFHVDSVRLSPLGGIKIYPGGRAVAVEPSALPLPTDSRQARDAVRFADLSEGYTVLHPRDRQVFADVRYAMLPNGLEPLWGIRIDPGAPDRPVELVTTRDTSRAILDQFFTMLTGGEPNPTQPLPGRHGG